MGDSRDRRPPRGCLRRTLHRSASMPPPPLKRQGRNLTTEETQPHRNPKVARGSEADHRSGRREKPEVAIRNSAGGPPRRPGKRALHGSVGDGADGPASEVTRSSSSPTRTTSSTRSFLPRRASACPLTETGSVEKRLDFGSAADHAFQLQQLTETDRFSPNMNVTPHQPNRIDTASPGGRRQASDPKRDRHGCRTSVE